MAIKRKPATNGIDPLNGNFIIFGDHDAGKNHFLRDFPKKIEVISMDGGGAEGHGHPTIEVNSMDDFREAIKLLKNTPEKEKAQYIVLDTIDRLQEFIQADIARKDGKTSVLDVGYFSEGIRKSRESIKNIVDVLTAEGYKVILLAWESKYLDPDTKVNHIGLHIDKGVQSTLTGCSNTILRIYKDPVTGARKAQLRGKGENIARVRGLDTALKTPVETENTFTAFIDFYKKNKQKPFTLKKPSVSTPTPTTSKSPFNKGAN